MTDRVFGAKMFGYRKPKVEHNSYIELAYFGPASLDIDALVKGEKDWMGGHDFLMYSGNMCSVGRRGEEGEKRIPISDTDNIIKVDIVPFPAQTKSGIDFIAVYLHRRATPI